MADDNDTPANDTGAPVPRRRASRKTTSKTEAVKRASRPATTPAKKSSAKSTAEPVSTQSSTPTPQSRPDRSGDTPGKATDAVGGKRGLIAGGLIAAAAGAAAAALLALRGSTPGKKAVPANDTGSKAHQPEGTDSSGQMEAMIADESMIPEAPQG
ncbi:hypothetical protein [uncultured Sphingomonas sp.]|uniref:hypothetical protein n=1 Tax=uncultured Sphingomonas sp. TaxID=158754 RepID=UPI0035CA2404